MRTTEQEAAHLYAVQHLVSVSRQPGVVEPRQARQRWDAPPAGLRLTRTQWERLVDAEVAPFVGGRVYVQGDRLVPESAVLAGGAR